MKLDWFYFNLFTNGRIQTLLNATPLISNYFYTHSGISKNNVRSIIKLNYELKTVLDSINNNFNSSQIISNKSLYKLKPKPKPKPFALKYNKNNFKIIKEFINKLNKNNQNKKTVYLKALMNNQIQMKDLIHITNTYINDNNLQNKSKIKLDKNLKTLIKSNRGNSNDMTIFKFQNKLFTIFLDKKK